LNLAPRAAFTWNATKKTTLRGGYGIFYDWYDAGLYEQTIRVDGEHQVDVIVQNPGFPVLEGGGARLPASVIRAASLDQPTIQQASVGLERPLAAWADSAPTTCGPAAATRSFDQRQRAGPTVCARTRRSATSARFNRPASERRTASPWR
jgi:hypothetical protein